MVTLALFAASVVVCVEQPPSEAPAAAMQKDAQAVMARLDRAYVQATIEKLASFGTRHSLSTTTDPARGIGAARNWIKTEFEGFTRAGGQDVRPTGFSVSFEEFTPPVGGRISSETKFVNVVAVLRGSKTPERRYYVVGHYDSMPSDVMDPAADAPGANDDASGTAAVLAIARAMEAWPCESTIVFLCTSGEEQGLIGAKYHAEQAATRKEDIRAVLNNDIIGDSLGPMGDEKRAARGTVRIFSEGLPRNATSEQLARIRQLGSEVDSPSRQLARYVAEIAEREKTALKPMLVYRLDRFLRGGDHSAFNDAGFAAVRFCQTHENYDHQHQTPREEKRPDGTVRRYGDLPEFVDFEYVANVARLNAAVLIHLANAPSVPGNVRIVTAKLETTTTLRWSASPEADVAGYEVVWRDTTSPAWTHTKDVGLTTEITLDENKDNVYFGVRAYDTTGYRSPVAFTGAARE
ncbi:MAG: M20/M25/M40 family metallo-hydrolase [Phycisphaerales bacterium]